ncbi:protein of unknown function [Shinella sp. WSC3-e]|nr:protein of unknown function [Shinella sp. WSC3-e]
MKGKEMPGNMSGSAQGKLAVPQSPCKWPPSHTFIIKFEAVLKAVGAFSPRGRCLGAAGRLSRAQRPSLQLSLRPRLVRFVQADQAEKTVRRPTYRRRP